MTLVELAPWAGHQAGTRYLLSRSGREHAGMGQSGMTLPRDEVVRAAEMAFCPSVWGNVELSLELHPALIPAAPFCVIKEDRLNSAWLQSQGSGRVGKSRFPYCVVYCRWALCAARRGQPLPRLVRVVEYLHGRTMTDDRHIDTSQCRTAR